MCAATNDNSIAITNDNSSQVNILQPIANIYPSDAVHSGQIIAILAWASWDAVVIVIVSCANDEIFAENENL